MQGAKDSSGGDVMTVAASVIAYAEVSSRYVLHWDCRGALLLPHVDRRGARHVEELHLRQCGLRELQADFHARLPGLEQLYLAGNLIEKLPESLPRLHRTLTVLDLGLNRLEDLPVEIGDMRGLKSLDLRQNKLIELPQSIGNLTSLRTLILPGNQLVRLPESIGKLTSLEALYLMDNDLAALPSSLRRCRNLCLLYVDGNRLAAIPSSAADLPRLDRLRASNNRLRGLPAQPFSSRNARVLFDGNPDLNYFPFTFGCRQSSLNAMVAAASRAVIEDDDKSGVVWTFDVRGCGSYRDQSSNSYREDQEEDLVGIWIRWIDGRRQFLAMPRQFESASAFNPKTGRFEGVSVPSLTELCTRTVFRLAFDPATDTAVSQFLANGRPICSVRERAGGERRPTAFGRSLGATAKTRLPATLLQRLREGPNAYCEADGCGTALFTHAALLLVTPGVVPPSPSAQIPFLPRVASSLYFCDAACAVRWLEGGDNSGMVDAVYRARAEVVRVHIPRGLHITSRETQYKSV